MTLCFHTYVQEARGVWKRVFGLSAGKGFRQSTLKARLGLKADFIEKER